MMGKCDRGAVFPLGLSMKKFGKFLQIVALTALPTGMLLEISDVLGRSFGLSQLLIVLVFGFAVFTLGRLVEGYARW